MSDRAHMRGRVPRLPHYTRQWMIVPGTNLRLSQRRPRCLDPMAGARRRKMATELGIDAHMMKTVLDKHVRQHLRPAARRTPPPMAR
jgi:hypothetical protein